MRKLIFGLFVILFYIPCTLLAQKKGSAAMPHTLVYKAKKRYRNLVPVQLSDDKKTVVSYPGPADVKTGSGGYLLPVLLHNGYLLDRFGVGLNTAFIKLTYKQYAKLKSVDVATLFQHVKAADPFLYFYTCGKRRSYKNLVSELNAKIKAGKLTTCDCLHKP